MFYFGARYYDADVGRWVSTDPAEQYFDRYAYGPYNPVNGIDPDGEFWREAGAVGGGLVATWQASSEYGVATGDYGLKNSLVTGATFFITTGLGLLGSGAEGKVVAKGVVGVVIKYSIAGATGAATSTANSLVRISAGEERNLSTDAQLGFAGGIGGKLAGDFMNKTAGSVVDYYVAEPAKEVFENVVSPAASGEITKNIANKVKD